MNKCKIAKIINVIFCIALIIIMMHVTYNSWSSCNYNLLSFFASLYIDSVMGIMIYLGINWWINKYLKK